MVAPHVSEVLLAIAYGDAFGSGFEAVLRPELGNMFPGGWAQIIQEPYRPSIVTSLPPGSYTDDTQMSVAVAEALLESRGESVPLSADLFARQFVAAFRRDPRDGYASGRNRRDGQPRFQEILEACPDGPALRAALKPHSVRNGAAMRSVPLGLLHSPEEVVSAAIENARVTHDTPQGRASSAAVALASHYFLYELGPCRDVGYFCAERIGEICPDNASHVRRIAQLATYTPEAVLGHKNDGTLHRGIPVNGKLTAGAVLHLAACFPDDVCRTLGEAIALGGDTDTVAAVACGIVGIRTGVGALPAHIREGLEDGPYGKRFLAELGNQLCSLL